jgi:hypothetical protein
VLGVSALTKFLVVFQHKHSKPTAPTLLQLGTAAPAANDVVHAGTIFVYAVLYSFKRDGGQRAHVGKAGPQPGSKARQTGTALRHTEWESTVQR